MLVNDPLGDMLTRIRNAQMRSKSTVKTPASKLRGWVLDILASEGYIRGYEAMDGADGKPAFEIPVHSGVPVIVACLGAPGSSTATTTASTHGILGCCFVAHVVVLNSRNSRASCLCPDGHIC